MKKDWSYFCKELNAADVTADCLVLVLESSGFACGPVSFTMYHLLKGQDEIPLFKAALASPDSHGGGWVKDEIIKVVPLAEFLAEEQIRQGLIEDYNLVKVHNISADYKFNIPDDEALIADILSFHNLVQF